MTANRILLIEDEPDLRAGLQHNLQLEGFQVDSTGDGKSGLQQALNKKPDLILLDLMLPGMSGLEVLRQLRSEGLATPIIIVSAKGQELDKVAGLELGADDYITKPFALNELMARVRAVLRRSPPSEEEGATDQAAVHRFQDLIVDFKRFTVTRDGEEIQLSRYEAEILRVLVERRGEVVSRQDLLRRVWGYVHLPTTRTVDNHIARLRKKIERDVEAPIHVVTVHGLGYRFESVPVEAA
jgi:DNA-binding response OmpR family regulator